MIVLEGNITNKVINGVNGDFSVGNFRTEIGQFKIRSTLLDQYDEGEYRVRVTINHLDLNSYMSKTNGITITEIVADIDHIELIDGESKTVQAEPIEPDASVDNSDAKSTKADQFPAEKRKPKNPGVVNPVSTSKVCNAPDVDDSELADLFGHLWPLGSVVKLDSTMPRPLFIRQKDYLKSHGYRFDGADQTWHLD